MPLFILFFQKKRKWLGPDFFFFDNKNLLLWAFYFLYSIWNGNYLYVGQTTAEIIMILYNYGASQKKHDAF